MEERAAESKTFGRPNASLEYWFDERGFNTINLTGGAPLPHGWNLWGFVDLHSLDEGTRGDTQTYFMEVNLTRKLWSSGGVVFELNDGAGADNNVTRAGIFLQPDIGFLDFSHVKLFPLESDGTGSQLAFAWNKVFKGLLDGRVSAGGFLDFNFESGADENTNVVTETQLRYRVFENFHVVLEFRYNEFLSDEYGTAIGIKYGF